MNPNNTSRLLILLAPLVISFAIGQDIFVPEVPQLIGIFHTDQSMVQLALSLFILAAGAGQLVVGPLSDQFGRKIVVLTSIAAYFIGSIIAAGANSINILILARIIQGLGACGMMVCAFAMVRDLSSGNESAKLYSYLNSAIAISPLLAPLAGGYLDTWFGWRAPFISLVVIGALIFITTAFFIKETQNPANKITFNVQILARYWQIMRKTQFAVYSFASASTIAVFFIFFSISSYLIITILGVPEIDFGYYFALIGITFFFANMLAAKLVVRWGIFKVVLTGTIGFTITGVIMLIWTLTLGTSIVSFILPTCFSAMFGACMLGAGAAGALEPFGKMAGTAAALLGAFEFLFASFIGTLVLHWPVKSNLSYALPLTLAGTLSTIACSSYHFFRKDSGQ